MYGIYLACRTLHQEIENDFIAKLRPFLDIAYGWRAVPTRTIPPSMDIAVAGGPATALEYPHISIFDLVYESPSPFVQHHAECLGRLFSLPAHILTFHIYSLFGDVMT
jgi:hypothetical protein